MGLLSTTFVLTILEDYLWRKKSVEVSWKEYSYRCFPWIQTSRKPNKMVWVTITITQVNDHRQCSTVKSYLAHFLRPSSKKFLYFDKLNFSALILKKFLYFFIFWETKTPKKVPYILGNRQLEKNQQTKFLYIYRIENPPEISYI